MGRLWLFYSCIWTVLLTSLLGVNTVVGNKNTVLVAHHTNVVKIIRNDKLNHFVYKTVLPPLAKHGVFKKVNGLDCDATKEMICWTDSNEKSIRCSHPQPTSKCSDTSSQFTAYSIIGNLGEPEDVALDPCHMMLYWTDPIRSTVSVAKIRRNDLDEIKRVTFKDILSSSDGLHRPMSIAVDSCEGYVFFTDDEDYNGKILRADTDGMNLVQIYGTSKSDGPSIRLPRALALDRKNKHIYFAHGMTISKINYNGKSIEKIETGTTARGLAMVNDIALSCETNSLYYTEMMPGHPGYISLEGQRSNLLRLRYGIQSYTGACSYCENCNCKSSSRCACQNGGCSHLCFPLSNGQRRCGCPSGYVLDPQDKITCKVEAPQLLVGNVRNLLSLKADVRGRVTGTSKALAFGLSSNMVGLDFLPWEKSPYVVYTDHHALKRRTLDGSKQLTITDGLNGLRGVAADCVTGNVYYADYQNGFIAVTDFTGTLHKVCYSTPDVNGPLFLAMNPSKREFYFSDIGEHKIVRAPMDCSESPTQLFRVHFATGIALDESSQILYWTEFLLRVIRAYDIEASRAFQLSISRPSVYLSRPFGLTMLGDYLYFTDWHSGCVSSITKTGGTVKNVSCYHDHKIHGITHVSKQCQKPQGFGQCNCEHPKICLLSSTDKRSFACACPTGFTSVNGKCKLPDNDFVLVASVYGIKAMSLGGKSNWMARLPIPPQRNVIDVDYDTKDGRVFWADREEQKIMSAQLDGTQMQTLLTHDPDRIVCRLCKPSGIAYDWKQRKLYFTDSESGEICYIGVDGGVKGKVNRVLNGLTQPRAIVVSPDQSRLYFTEWKIPKIWSLSIPQDSVQELVKDNLTLPSALAVGSKAYQLYYGDGKQHYLALYNTQSHITTPMAKTTTIFGLDEYNGYIYWTELATGVFRMPLRGGDIQKLASTSDVFKARGIKVYSRNKQQ